MQKYRRIAAIAITAAATALPMMAQSEGGLLLGAEAQKKLSSNLSVGLEADMRSRNDFKTMDRWSIGLGATYKLSKHLKADLGYTLIDNNFREKITYKTSGSLNKWRPSYWGLKHRAYASLTGSYKLPNNLKLSLRERYQFTYRPEKTVQRWDFDEAEWQDKVRQGKSKSQLRSRLQAEYDKKRALFTPYASIELYNSMKLEKMRYTIGTDIRLTKQHSLDIFYRYQDTKKQDDFDYNPDMHYIGLGYKFKF